MKQVVSIVLADGAVDDALYFYTVGPSSCADKSFVVLFARKTIALRSHDLKHQHTVSRI